MIHAPADPRQPALGLAERRRPHRPADRLRQRPRHQRDPHERDRAGPDQRPSRRPDHGQPERAAAAQQALRLRGRGRGPAAARPPARRVDQADRHRRPDRGGGVRDRAPADGRAHRLPARRADPDPDAARLSRARLQPQRQHRRGGLPEAREQRRRAPAVVDGGHQRGGRPGLRQGRHLQPRPRGRDRERGRGEPEGGAGPSSARSSASPRSSTCATRATRITRRSWPATAR